MPEVDDWNTKIIEEFRANGGKVGGQFEGAPMLIMHTTGAKSGKERVIPVMYQVAGDHFAVFASKAGAPSHPDWYHNLVAHPDITVEVGSDTVAVSARVTKGDERQEIWTRQKKDYPQFAGYEEATTREIPVVLLERTG